MVPPWVIFALFKNKFYRNKSRLQWDSNSELSDRKASTMTTKPPLRYKTIDKAQPWSSLVEEDEYCNGPSGKLLRLRRTQKNILHMHGNIPYFFDFWADPFVNLKTLYQEASYDVNTVYPNWKNECQLLKV